MYIFVKANSKISFIDLHDHMSFELLSALPLEHYR